MTKTFLPARWAGLFTAAGLAATGLSACVSGPPITMNGADEFPPSNLPPGAMEKVPPYTPPSVQGTSSDYVCIPDGSRDTSRFEVKEGLWNKQGDIYVAEITSVAPFRMHIDIRDHHVAYDFHNYNPSVKVRYHVDASMIGGVPRIENSSKGLTQEGVENLKSYVKEFGIMWNHHQCGYHMDRMHTIYTPDGESISNYTIALNLTKNSPSNLPMPRNGVLDTVFVSYVTLNTSTGIYSPPSERVQTWGRDITGGLISTKVTLIAGYPHEFCVNGHCISPKTWRSTPLYSDFLRKAQEARQAYYKGPLPLVERSSRNTRLPGIPANSQVALG